MQRSCPRMLIVIVVDHGLRPVVGSCGVPFVRTARHASVVPCSPDASSPQSVDIEERRAAQKLKKLRPTEEDDIGYTAEQLEQIRIEQLEAAARRPLVDPDAVRLSQCLAVV